MTIPSDKDKRHLVRWFAMLVMIGPIHIAEQLMFGLDTLDELKALMAIYYSHFNNPDIGTVMLVIFLVSLVQMLLLATLAGGRWRLFAAGLFGMQAVGEGHHLVQTLSTGAYFPGVATSIAYVWIGIVILRDVVREWPAAARPVEEHMATA